MALSVRFPVADPAKEGVGLAWGTPEAVVALAVAALTAASSFSAGAASRPPSVWVLLALTAFLPALVVVLGAMRCFASRVRPAALLETSSPTPPERRGQLLCGLAAGAALVFLCSLLAGYSQAVLRLLGIPPVEQDSVRWLTGAGTPLATKWLLALSAVFVAPPCEEILYRGILLSEALRRFGPRRRHTAILAAALLFALAHGSLSLLLPFLLFGAVCGELAERGGSLVPGMVLHATFNAANVAFLLFLPPGGA